MTPSDVAANAPLIANTEIQVQRANLLDIVDIMKRDKKYWNDFIVSQNFWIAKFGHKYYICTWTSWLCEYTFSIFFTTYL